MYLATAADYLTRSPAVSKTTLIVTMAWVRHRSLPTSTNYTTYFGSLNGTPAGHTEYVSIRGTSAPLDVYRVKYGATDNTSVSVTSAPSNLWRHITVMDFGSGGGTVWINGEPLGTVSVGRNGLSSLVTEVLGGDSFGSNDLDVVYARQWSGGGWTNAIVHSELGRITAGRTSGLLWDTPLIANVLDISGNARHWTQQGSGVFDGVRPAIFDIANNTPATATVLTGSSITESIPTAFPTNQWNRPVFFTPGRASYWYTFTGAGTLQFHPSDPACDMTAFVTVWDSDVTLGEIQAMETPDANGLSGTGGTFREPLIGVASDSGTVVNAPFTIATGGTHYIRIDNDGDFTTATCVLDVDFPVPEDPVDPVPEDASRPCCGTKPPLGGDTGEIPDPVGPLPPWMASCEGGGLVDSVVDLSDGESWL